MIDHERGLALRTDAARTRILTGVRLDAEERAALERIVLHAAIVVDQARALLARPTMAIWRTGSGSSSPPPGTLSSGG